MKYRIKNTKITIIILAIYQILGGLAGLWITSWLLLNTQNISGGALLIFITAIFLYYFSIKCGSILLRYEYKRGLIYSMIHQALQIIGIGFGGYAYTYSSGGKLIFGPDFTNGINFRFDFALASQFNFSINIADKVYFLYVNILALFLLYLFWDLYKEIILGKEKESTPPKEKTEIYEKFVI